MSKPKPRKIPSRRRHATGQAFVELSGKRIYLGKYDSPESKQRYDRQVAAWKANGYALPVAVDDLTVTELCDQFMVHAKDYYRKAGRQTSEYGRFAAAIRLMLPLYGSLAVEKFGVMDLRVVRNAMIEKGWTRKSLNIAVGRIRHVFRWGVGQAMVNPHVLQSLESVEPLKLGRSRAAESPGVKPVPDNMVDATLPHLSPTIQAMVNLQRITGMRSGELTAMRGRDLDTTAETWVYSPEQHKTEHHDRPRAIHLGRRAQAIIEPFLKADLSAHLFSPVDADVALRAELHAQRVAACEEIERTYAPSERKAAYKAHHVARLSCGNVPGSNKSEGPIRKPGARYTTNSYRRSIARACEKAWPAPEELTDDEKADWRKKHHWHPHQLRHLAATRLRKRFGLEAARVVLGHTTTSMTELYAEVDFEKAASIAAQVG
jgi:integrase